MNLTRLSLVVIAFAILVIGLPRAHADEKADRAAIADALNKLAASASSLAQTAKSSDDRGARKKFAPAAADLGDDLAALARRAGKDVPFKTISKDAAAIEKDATALVELADEADDKDERKSLRANAALISQNLAGVRKTIDSASTKADAAPPAPSRFTGQLINNSGDCSWSENVYFIVSANGQVVYKSGLVFPGKAQSLVLEKATYFVQVTDTAGSKQLAQGQLAPAKDGWAFKTGCVNQD